MEIKKSSRHQKIIGNFGENLICNWLSRSGFEVILVDHTGIDILAYSSSTKERIGITVKSRTRDVGKEYEPVNIFSLKKETREKVLEACKSFACEPWIGIYVETSKSGKVYLTSLKNYDKKYRGKLGRSVQDWKMGNKYLELYEKDTKVMKIKIEFELADWEN